MSDRYAYLDTSAFVKLCWPELESPALRRHLRRWPIVVSSVLLWTEALRAASRQPLPRLSVVRQRLRDVALVQVDRGILEHAGILAPPENRSIDALHVATALSLGSDLAVVVTYDQRMADAATSQGLSVVAPA